MRTIHKIAVLGGDRRTEMILAGLRRAYPEVSLAVWGTEGMTAPEYVHSTKTWQEAMSGAQVGILPIPVTRDGETLSADPHANQTVPLEALCRFLRPGSLLLGGIVPQVVMRMAGENAVYFADYYADGVVQTLNAVPTAEGALAIAIRELPVILPETTAVIAGYGRCAKALANRLHLLGAKVIVAARRPEALAEAACDGCDTVLLNAFLTDPLPCRILFNTIPAPVFTGECLTELPEDCVFVELAHGLPPSLEIPHHIRLIRAPGLPGRTAPDTAGRILCDAILEKIGVWQQGEPESALQKGGHDA
ncbi:MAG: hypothetical protein IJ480_01215 [Clostridia bacterium]|nr:hypothetical protein [Clostridia bacterium]